MGCGANVLLASHIPRPNSASAIACADKQSLLGNSHALPNSI
jgi:hypothetical protein